MPLDTVSLKYSKIWNRLFEWVGRPLKMSVNVQYTEKTTEDEIGSEEDI